MVGCRLSREARVVRESGTRTMARRRGRVLNRLTRPAVTLCYTATFSCCRSHAARAQAPTQSGWSIISSATLRCYGLPSKPEICEIALTPAHQFSESPTGLLLWLRLSASTARNEFFGVSTSSSSAWLDQLPLAAQSRAMGETIRTDDHSCRVGVVGDTITDEAVVEVVETEEMLARS